VEREYTEAEIAIVAEALEARLAAEESLYEFTKQAWPSVEGNIPFVGGWHMEIICKCLESLFRREFKDGLFNVPPGTSKTTLISIMFPVWCWIHDVEETFMCASYAAAVSLEQSLKCRRLLESEWFQSRWGDRVKLASDQSAKGFFYNSCFGYRIATSVTGATTGRRAAIKIADDPNDVNDAYSEVKIQGAANWWNQVWPSRSKDPKKDIRIVVQQRVGERDISGLILNSDNADSWLKLILPMEFDPSNKCTITFPNGEVWEDPRTEEGQLLCEDRIGPRQIASFKSHLGEYGYAGQYQQRPSPMAGGIIKRHWFILWDKLTPPDIEYVVQSWDTAYGEKESNCYSACTTWGIFKISGDTRGLILLSLWRGRVGFPELRVMAQRLYRDYRDDGEITLTPSTNFRPDYVLIEEKMTGGPLIQELTRAGIPVIGFNPGKYGDKSKRVHMITPLLEAGRVYVPGKPPFYKEPRKFAETLVEECVKFNPLSITDRDLVDTMTQALIRLNRSGWIMHPSDDDRSDTSIRIKKPIY